MISANAISLITLVRDRLRHAKDTSSSLSRYETLLAGAALDIALRELSAGDEAIADMTKALAQLSPDPQQNLQAALACISEDVRDGRYDGDPAIFEALLAVAKINLSLSNPKLLASKVKKKSPAEEGGAKEAT